MEELDKGSMSMDINRLFGRENLDHIQESLSKATGLAFVTVDYRGEAVSNKTYFCAFCRRFREDEELRINCSSSDAVGSIQAAVTRRPYIYFCPCGLMEMAIPIVIDGNYLGGFLGGQVRCEDAPESVRQVGATVDSPRFRQTRNESEELFQELPVYAFEKFQDMANLVSLVINQLSENRVNQYFQEDLLKKRIRKIQEASQRHMKDKEKLQDSLHQLEVRSDPYCLADMLTSLQNLSIAEHAPRTTEFADLLIQYTRYCFEDKGTFVTFADELNYVEQYLKFQKMRMGNRFTYAVQFPKEMFLMKLPADILLPFVKNAVYHGVMPKPEGGSVEITGYVKNKKMVLQINDTGCGFSEDEINLRFESYKDNHEGYYIRMGMESAQHKMKQLFESEAAVTMERIRNEGCRCEIVFPEYR